MMIKLLIRSDESILCTSVCFIAAKPGFQTLLDNAIQALVKNITTGAVKVGYIYAIEYFSSKHLQELIVLFGCVKTMLQSVFVKTVETFCIRYHTTK